MFRLVTEPDLLSLKEEARAPLGPGRPGQFVGLNCAAMSEEQAERDLFGHARGAHSTGGDGLVTKADGGTLFLDGIGEASPRIQAALLRFLKNRNVRVVGGTSSRRLDVKVIAAAHPLESEGRGAGRLREDLLARVGAESVTIPPLRRRMEDLAQLVCHFAGGRPMVFEPEAHRAMYCYAWPQNVRELEMVVGRALALADNGPVGLEHLPAAVREASRTGRPVTTVGRRQRAAPSPEALKALLAEHDGNVAAVARALDRQWTVVWRWVTKHGLIPQRGGRGGPRRLPTP